MHLQCKAGLGLRAYFFASDAASVTRCYDSQPSCYRQHVCSVADMQKLVRGFQGVLLTSRPCSRW